MSESNDKAFIKISKELLCLRNDLEALKKISNVTQHMNTWQRDSMTNMRFDRVHSQGFEGLSKAVKLMSDSTAMKAELNKIEAEILKLEQLSEAYIRGEDIVKTRLSMD